MKVRLLENGICGSDREIVRGRLATSRPPPGKDWLVLGHEAIGIVEESSDPRFKPGELVMPVNRRSYEGHCLNCLVGRPDFCEAEEYVEAGMVGMDGFMVEYYYDDPKYLVKVPSEIKDIAILAQPLSDLEKSIEEILAIQRRFIWTCDDGTYNCRRAIVFGSGATGTLFALLLKTYGFEVYIANRRDPLEGEAKIADEAGLVYYNYTKESLDKLKKLGFDLVIDTTGASASLIRHEIEILKPNGVLGLFGFPSEGEAVIPYDVFQRFIYKANVVVGIINGQKPHFQLALSHLAQWKSVWPGVTKRLITKVISINDEKEVIKALNAKEPGEIKVKIKWD
ncbi:alcohol dehydrogenase [Vulcanisaeta souniana JCM 11219]|uniref:Glucose 1-dehydrogenase n=1 Tax=Vulcanisaeta souniana JCM 11219 TaxID=1293586 RepID=A0A830EAU9_9CREN|nr:alcohol dehydrogenase [Vulcanisaeta souniana JCM 11219]